MPSETRSPSATLIAVTLPAAGDGTSIVALSDSSSISGSSAATVSPTATSTVTTGTSLKSPISGTLTSMARAPLQHQPAHVAEQEFQGAQKRAARAPSIAR